MSSRAKRIVKLGQSCPQEYNSINVNRSKKIPSFVINYELPNTVEKVEAWLQDPQNIPPSSPKSYHILTPCKLVREEIDLWKISAEGNTTFGQQNDGATETHNMGNQININSITTNNNILL